MFTGQGDAAGATVRPMWYLIVYAAVVALGALIGHLRGSVQLGVLWTMVLGPLGLVLLVFTTPST